MQEGKPKRKVRQVWELKIRLSCIGKLCGPVLNCTQSSPVSMPESDSSGLHDSIVIVLAVWLGCGHSTKGNGSKSLKRRQARSLEAKWLKWGQVWGKGYEEILLTRESLLSSGWLLAPQEYCLIIQFVNRNQKCLLGEVLCLNVCNLNFIKRHRPNSLSMLGLLH